MYTLMGILFLVIAWFANKEFWSSTKKDWYAIVVVVCGFIGIGFVIYGLLPVFKVIK